ncbi:glycoside hydrolase [Enterococcus sp. 6D12_DIV0197]|jgi:alpha-galactosidase|uniref:Alpha-glucosidase/alpha-galactosidase n=1 Tax=Enterococcus casseliflavus TaxID=37734 RepID=A0A415ER65_ENTCA|nr:MULTISPECIES: alpha-glucosidase/alpha-galactosidase [Enterococcus]MCD5190961.1 alpha-glucosidase/alpha-galactosidase [Enterococcus casseliflavus]MEB6145971.1 alpha-glucosidase/alpha-galactosidase [Enterococcus casseliflavus]MUN74911.1 alpha-galactosidase [Enterococcus casseliflavus]MUN95206.1 alpha-galactosidase [Enterococcus casseliflavus]NKD39426.1 alpha-glucosidase/alpha-galactosidase [Enterococcus casseliflavus]
MTKITFIGAGSTIFAKNVLGDAMLTPSLADSHIALYDIDEKRLRESEAMLKTINKNANQNRAEIQVYHDRKEALRDADFVVNAIQVGGYKPSTVIDFEIPKKYGLRQTIGDTMGIGGIFRTLRTLPVMLEFAREMEEVCPNAWLLNYTNPMAMLTMGVLKATSIKTVGLCHSVQVCVPELFEHLGIKEQYDLADFQWKIAGINHMAFLLEITKDGEDFYPTIRQLAEEKENPHRDSVRFELMKRFGYYITESSEHNAEYHPYFIKSKYPELIDDLGIPLDEYLTRCENQIRDWETMREDIVDNGDLTHKRSREYASYIMDAIKTGNPTVIAGNVLNKGLITNLPEDVCVEVPCLVDKNGIQPTYVGALPTQLAALNRTNINVQELTVEAALTLEKDKIYQAAYLDPHLSSELSLADITQLVDDLIEAHGDYLPDYH